MKCNKNNKIKNHYNILFDTTFLFARGKAGHREDKSSTKSEDKNLPRRRKLLAPPNSPQPSSMRSDFVEECGGTGRNENTIYYANSEHGTSCVRRFFLHYRSFIASHYSKRFPARLQKKTMNTNTMNPAETTIPKKGEEASIKKTDIMTTETLSEDDKDGSDGSSDEKDDKIDGLRQLKRAKRLAMNRESARARRKRKKMLIESLETQVSDLSTSNQNYKLRIATLEQELAVSRQTIASLLSNQTSGSHGALLNPLTDFPPPGLGKEPEGLSALLQDHRKIPPMSSGAIASLVEGQPMMTIPFTASSAAHSIGRLSDYQTGKSPGLPTAPGFLPTDLVAGQASESTVQGGQAIPASLHGQQFKILGAQPMLTQQFGGLNSTASLMAIPQQPRIVEEALAQERLLLWRRQHQLNIPDGQPSQSLTSNATAAKTLLLQQALQERQSTPSWLVRK